MESGLVAPEQISKKIRPSGTAKCGEETLSCILNSIGVLSRSDETHRGGTEAFKATSDMECETVGTESRAPSSVKTSVVSFDADAGKPTSQCCGTSEIVSQ